MNRTELAVSCFEEGFSCSQAVLLAYSAQFGLPREVALKIAEAFGAGMGGMAQTCGAVTGSFMVIGLEHGRLQAGDVQAKDKTRELVREFVKRFRSRNDSIVCRELLDCDISLPESMEFAKENGLFETRCPVFVRDAAEILEELGYG